ncbi:MAG: hypothetical protein P8171_25125, partial [Candidatus Thiodiazotropha sp.]
MYPRSQRSPHARLTLVCALVSLGVFTISPPVQATTTYLNSWRANYPDSATDDNLASPCTLCHTD